jgi:hypothetical protein
MSPKEQQDLLAQVPEIKNNDQVLDIPQEDLLDTTKEDPYF